MEFIPLFSAVPQFGIDEKEIHSLQFFFKIIYTLLTLLKSQ